MTMFRFLVIMFLAVSVGFSATPYFAAARIVIACLLMVDSICDAIKEGRK